MFGSDYPLEAYSGDTVRELVEMIGGLDLPREAKQAIDRGFGLPLETAIELEDLAWRRNVASSDRREGVAAFNEKREPAWKGR